MMPYCATPKCQKVATHSLPHKVDGQVVYVCDQHDRETSSRAMFRKKLPSDPKFTKKHTKARKQ